MSRDPLWMEGNELDDDYDSEDILDDDYDEDDEPQEDPDRLHDGYFDV